MLSDWMNGCDVRTVVEYVRESRAPVRSVRRDGGAWVHASSGTTGKPTVVGYTRGDIDTWADLVARSLRACGVRPGMLVHISVGYGLFTGGIGMHYGAERLGCTWYPWPAAWRLDKSN